MRPGLPLDSDPLLRLSGTPEPPQGFGLTGRKAGCLRAGIFFLPRRRRINYFIRKRMKTACSLLVLIASAAYASASAGPPPFTNGSPLISGVDGSYQATVRGKNLSGIFRFSYSSGNQTDTDSANKYAIFVDGQCYTGDVHAAINTDTVGGVLDTSDAEYGNTASGFFNGDMDQNSAYASFSGEGSLTLVNGDIEADTVNSDTTGSSSIQADDVTGTGTADGSTSTGGSASGGSTSSAVTAIDGAGNGTANVETTANGDQVVVTTETQDPLISTTRDFTFSGVRNSMSSR